MIRVIKLTAPPVLITRGGTAAQTHCDAHDKSPAAYRRRKKPATFDFDPTIYAHDEVKSALRKAQYDKCAFCESKVTHICYGDVEHYRPKAGFRQHETDHLNRPGYYWLAYAWENLFLSCQLCNQRFKRELFPLLIPRQRARSHKGTVSKEKPLLLNPATDPIDQHITYIDETTAPVNGSRKGAATIKLLGLNRPELIDKRRLLRKDLLLMKDLRAQLMRNAGSSPSADAQRLLDKLNQRLAEAVQNTAPYAAMARMFL
ncbi:MAG: hypothetical protein JWO38_607 [Gemmataceae bacterium]|nr:hypothetical protein [Gemmataceae bacterium]